MPHPYPPHHDGLPYTGKYHYFLTFRTDQRRRVFIDPGHVALVRTQILRAAHERAFEIVAYCFMPDHVHLIVAGRTESSDLKTFVRLAKQYSGYYFGKEAGTRLWQRYGFERVVRDDPELTFTIGYVLRNPVRAGLVEAPVNYPHVGSERYTIEELLAICEERSSA